MRKNVFGGAAIFLAIVLLAPAGQTAQTTNISIVPSADTFVRAQNPGGNYGGAGAISVSGSAATNGSGQQNGIFDSLLRFSTSNIVAFADAALGTHDWIITRATMHFVELGAPASPTFNRGVGGFEIRWIAADNWIEGTGNPSGPTTDGLVYNGLGALLNPATDMPLGQFTNSGVDGPISFNLELAQPFIADLRSGNEVSLYFTATGPQVGFTADSRSFNTTNARPTLELVASARPATALSIQSASPNQVSLGFNTTSNWNYFLQGADALGSSTPTGWSNLLSAPAQSTNGHITFSDASSHPRRFYRVLITQ